MLGEKWCKILRGPTNKKKNHYLAWAWDEPDEELQGEPSHVERLDDGEGEVVLSEAGLVL